MAALHAPDEASFLTLDAMPVLTVARDEDAVSAQQRLSPTGLQDREAV
jgi:hypothetical protein